MPKEVERRFLLASLPLDVVIPKPHLAVQAYEFIEPERESRVRLWQTPDGNVSYKRAVKEGRGLSRTEDQTPITVQAFHQVLMNPVGRPIMKHVYEFPHGPRTIEVSRSLSHDPFVIVEVEFPSVGAAAAFQPPEWFGSEVTENPDYNSQSLALRGIPADYVPPPAAIITRLTSALPGAAPTPHHDNGC